jgi:hypothetical protein
MLHQLVFALCGYSIDYLSENPASVFNAWQCIVNTQRECYNISSIHYHITVGAKDKTCLNRCQKIQYYPIMLQSFHINNYKYCSLFSCYPISIIGLLGSEVYA